MKPLNFEPYADNEIGESKELAQLEAAEGVSVREAERNVDRAERKLDRALLRRQRRRRRNNTFECDGLAWLFCCLWCTALSARRR
jgi:hypothetical protein